MKRPVAKPAADFTFANHGSICLLTPQTDAAREWLDENVGGENQWYAGALVVEPRYVNDLCAGINAQGFRIANGPGGLN